MYEFYSFLQGYPSRKPRRLPSMSAEGVVRFVIAFAIIAVVVTLLDHAAAGQVHSVVAAHSVDPIQWEK